MNDFISELIGFAIVTCVVVLLAYFTKKLESKYKNDEKK